MPEVGSGWRQPQLDHVSPSFRHISSASAPAQAPPAGSAQCLADPRSLSPRLPHQGTPEPPQVRGGQEHGAVQSAAGLPGGTAGDGARLAQTRPLTS